jgi:creatinine amidohydrolase
MTKLPARLWHEMATTDFDALDKERTIAVLQVASIEHHGPHLPVWVDACFIQTL